ncbi:MAG: hypothetical protein Q8O35_09895 [Humidesulfovibrio sp.]|uniref:hypothetical protein n=1 Tax=Humidesulfovibrio sp. TaxID=2910988 RepID=UPI002732C09B|nr:hypothetical protein [Humidesulfovibrio sp.]MDP2848492.1 hypothetical protein [Humidesulfovibrio sp.]
MAESLRPWALAGLSHLYLPEGVEIVAADPVAEAHSTINTPPQTTTAVEMVDETISPSAWPAPWSTLASRVRTPPRVIITYSSLADDVAGAADPARRKLFQSILSFLGWPAGTTLFWPISFPTGVDPGPHFASDLFAAGVRHFEIRHLLCFGSGPADRARTLFPQEDKIVLVHAAPAPEALTPLLPHELHQALAHLKGLALS